MIDNIYFKKILVVDDDKSIINMVDIVLRKEQFQKVFKAVNALEAVKLAKEIDPDLVILDIMLPDSDGYEVCKQIREFSMAPVIFLSAKNEETDKLVSFAVGGDEYLTKPFSPKELVARIRVALRRQIYYESGNQEKEKEKEEKEYYFGSGFCLDLETKTLRRAREKVSLRPREYDLLEYMVRNHNITLTKDMLIQKVWGSDYNGYENTVMVHIRHLREKIEDDPANPRFIKTVKSKGYYFDTKG